MSVDADGPGYPVRQRIQDASFPLQLLRAQHAEAWLTSHETAPGVELVTGGLEVMRDWIWRRSRHSREILSVTAALSVATRMKSEETDKAIVARGGRMLSLVDAHTLTDEVRDYLASLDYLTYYECYGPTQVKVFDRQTVALEGPLLEEQRSLLVVSEPKAVRLAMSYVNEVRRTAIPLGFECKAGELTQRQHSIADRMQAGDRDEEIAHALGVSVRTVRSDIAAIMEILGAKNRFAAGARYATRLQEAAEE